MMDDLDRLAMRHGIWLSHHTGTGEEVFVSRSAKVGLLGALGIVADTDDAVRSALAAPDHGSWLADEVDQPVCHVPAELEGGRCWGLTCQLYSLRSNRSAGLGDFADLASLGGIAAAHGADFIGVSPLHALFAADATRFSPYYPSSRRFLNPLYIALDWLDPSTHFEPSSAAALESLELVDYAGAWGLKHRALKAAFDLFMAGEGDDGFAEFRRRRGRALRDFATFEALSEAFVADGLGAGWMGWPDAFRDRESAAVASFVAASEDRITFHEWLQWIAHRQLSDVQNGLIACGMRIGLYLDIAVGVAPDGAETWSTPGVTLAGARIGCPPDRFNPQGQDWGLAPLSPVALREDGIGVMRDLFEQAMEAAGAIRMDHVMALERLYLIPGLAPTADGAYVSYPWSRILTELARASQRHRAMVVGEDLGTVRPGLREMMAQLAIHSYRVLLFERDDAEMFKPPDAWPAAALACATTHDLPTLAAWWQGLDLELAERFAITVGDAAARERAERSRDKTRLLDALRAAGLDLDPGFDAAPTLPDRVAVAVHRYIARTPSRLVAVQLEDAIGAIARINVPGTTTEHPNWRWRMPIPLEGLRQSPLFAAITEAVAQERPRP